MTSTAPFEAKCIVCTSPITLDRLRKKAITCSKECHEQHRKGMRALDHWIECPTCKRASTPAERAAFKRFRNLEEKFPQLLYPKQFKRFVAAGGKPEDFAEALKLDEDGSTVPYHRSMIETRELLSDELPQQLEEAGA